MLSASELAALEALFGPGVRDLTEAGIRFVFLPTIELPTGCKPSTLQGLYAAQRLDNYDSRLYLSAPVLLASGITPPTAMAVYFNQQWYAASIQGISPALPPHQAVLAHLARYTKGT